MGQRFNRKGPLLPTMEATGEGADSHNSFPL